jgi:hypothetical protein
LLGTADMTIRLVSFACFLALGCANSGGVGSACHLQSDCQHGLGCVGPDEGPVCGIGPQHGCDSDTDCAPSGEVCNAVPDGCSASGVGSMCGPRCTATSCGTGFTCSATGACEPTPCGRGTCAPYQRCDLPVTTGPVWSHTDGCADIQCMTTQDCPDALFCVNGFCQTSVGQCEKPMLVP